jgi:hypothetical protein
LHLKVRSSVFSNLVNSSIPEPGKYNPKIKIDDKPVNVDIYKHATIEERFQSKPTHVPGPGYYGADILYANSLLKKTYNITLDPPKTAI